MRGHAPLLVLGFVWGFVLLCVAMSAFWVPAGSWLVEVMPRRPVFASVLLAPLLGMTLLAFGWMDEMLEGTLPPEFASKALTCLVWYCLYVILATGGISGSPLSSLAAIVPLVAGGFTELSCRRTVLVRYVAGVVVVGGLSWLSMFSPASQYPPGSEWMGAGAFNVPITTGVIGLGILLELLMIGRGVAARGRAVGEEQTKVEEAANVLAGV